MQLVRIRAKLLHQRIEALQPFCLKSCKLPKTGFKQGRYTDTDRMGHIFVRGSRVGNEGNPEIGGNALQFNFFHDVNEGYDNPCRACTACSPCPVNVGFPIVRGFVQKNMGQVGNVYAPCGHIRGNKKTDCSITKVGKYIFPFALREVRGKFIRIETESLKNRRNIVDCCLCVAEDDGGGRVFHFKNAQERSVFVHALAFAVHVLDFRDVNLLCGQREQLWCLEKFSCQSENMRRVGGGKECRMNRRVGQVALTFLHVRVEADGQHPICLVKDNGGQVLEVQCPAKQVIKDTTRCPHNHGNPLSQGFHLFSVSHASVNGGHCQPAVPEQRLCFLLDLYGKFPRGNKNQGLDCGKIGDKAMQQGQQIGTGLSTSCARLYHDVAAFKHVGKSPFLDWHKF